MEGALQGVEALIQGGADALGDLGDEVEAGAARGLRANRGLALCRREGEGACGGLHPRGCNGCHVGNGRNGRLVKVGALVGGVVFVETEGDEELMSRKRRGREG